MTTTMSIKIATAGMSRDTWLEERRHGIGGSDAAAAMGLSPYKTPLELWEEKTGRAAGKPAGEAAYWGTQLEDLVAREFAKRTGLKIQHVNFMFTKGENGWMRGNIDRAIINPQISGAVRVRNPTKAAETGLLLSTDMALECKTAGAYSSDQWGDSQEDEIVAGKVVTEHKIPLYYETQIQWYMAVTGIKRYYVAVLIGGQDFRMYQIDRDEDVIAAITERCKSFWFDHVVADVPPAPINVDDIKKLYERDNGEMAEATNEQAADIGELRTLKDRIKELKAQEDAVASRVILAIGEKTGLMIGGQKAVTYKSQTANRFCGTEFKKEHPDLYADFLRPSTSRVLRLT